MMVDEYQDTNRPQYLLIQRLASRHRNLAVVGDPDQSIYKWRGADLKNILDFEHDFPRRPSCARAQLPLDPGDSRRRVGGDRQNKNRKESGSTPSRAAARRSSTTAPATTSTRPNSSPAPAAGAAGRLREPAAVLYRTNAQSRTVEDALRRAGIAYRIIGGVRFYERREVKDALSYLRLVLNPHDDVSLRRVINVPARGNRQRA
jgi:DNA helicase-2/ATP-dependent DNA helicase PcrA